MPGRSSNKIEPREEKSPKRKGRFSDQQILDILNEHIAGVSVAELRRRHGMSSTTFYKWRKKFQTQLPPAERDRERIRQLAEENRRLKWLLAEAVLENARLKDKGN